MDRPLNTTVEIPRLWGKTTCDLNFNQTKFQSYKKEQLQRLPEGLLLFKKEQAKKSDG